MKIHKYTSMKKVISFCILFTIIGGRVTAQESIIEGLNQEKLHRLIQMAKDYYPQRKILELNEEKARSMVTTQAVNFLDLVNVSYYYRPDERTALGIENPYVVNGFQFGASLNLGAFLQKPAQIKQAKADYKIAQLEKVAYDEELESEVKKRYYTYLQALSELKLRTQSYQDAKALNDDVQLRFEQGVLPLTDYSEAKATLQEAGSGKLASEVNYLQAKDAIEELIGTSLESVQ